MSLSEPHLPETSDRQYLDFLKDTMFFDAAEARYGVRGTEPLSEKMLAEFAGLPLFEQLRKRLIRSIQFLTPEEGGLVTRCLDIRTPWRACLWTNRERTFDVFMKRIDDSLHRALFRYAEFLGHELGHTFFTDISSGPRARHCVLRRMVTSSDRQPIRAEEAVCDMFAERWLAQDGNRQAAESLFLVLLRLGRSAWRIPPP
jgi:hypothetical protein